MDNSDERFARARLIKDRKRRFQAVWELCKGKMICEGSTEGGEEEDDGGKKTNTAKSTHGGCGQRQPKYKKSPLKFMAEFKAVRDEVKTMTK